MLKQEYNRMNEKISPDPALQEKVMEQAAPRRVRHFRPSAAIAAVLVIAMLAVPVMAAYVPAISDLMYQVSPEMAARFTPIQESCVVDGIKMEVVSASIHGATAEACISFEDVEGDRLDEHLRLSGGELLGKNPFLSGSWGGGIAYFNYDAEFGKAIMVIDETSSFYSEWKGRYLTVNELYGGKITVQVDYLFRYADTEDGTCVEEILAEGPWRVTFDITESDYVGENDDGIPATEYIGG